MKAPHLLVPLAAALLLAAATDATPITPNSNLSGTVHDGENHFAANGSSSDLSFASFVNTNLQSTIFVNTSFVSADLTRANLRFTNATGADFTGATVDRTQLRDGNFTNAVFDGVTFLTTNVRNANLSGASFLGSDLTGVTNWDTANWTGALIDAATVLPAGMDPAAEGMTFVKEPQSAVLMTIGLIGLGAFGRRRDA